MARDIPSAKQNQAMELRTERPRDQSQTQSYRYQADDARAYSVKFEGASRPAAADIQNYCGHGQVKF